MLVSSPTASSVTANTTPSLAQIEFLQNNENFSNLKISDESQPKFIQQQQLRSRSETMISTTSTISSVDSNNSNNKISSSFKKLLFIKPQKRSSGLSNYDDSNNNDLLPMIPDDADNTFLLTSPIEATHQNSVNSPESSFRSSYNDYTNLSSTTSIETFDDKRQIKARHISGSGFYNEEEDFEESLTIQPESFDENEEINLEEQQEDFFDYFNDELNYNSFLVKCKEAKSTNATKPMNPQIKSLRSKRSMFNIRRPSNINVSLANNSTNLTCLDIDEKPLPPPPTPIMDDLTASEFFKGQRSILYSKRHQEETKKLKHYRSVPSLRINVNKANKSDIHSPISPPMHYNRTSVPNSLNNSRPPSNEGRGSVASSHQSYYTTRSRNSEASLNSGNYHLNQDI